MKINLIIKKAEIEEYEKVLETISNLLPEEGFELPSIEELREQLENGRYFDQERYGSLLIVDDDGDLEVTIDLNQDFTTDTLRVVNKIVGAASGIVGAVVGFAGTMKVLGEKFIAKVTSIGEEFSKKWFAPAAIEENSEEPDADREADVEPEKKYGVYPMRFLWDDTENRTHLGVAVAIIERCDYYRGGFNVVTYKDNGGIDPTPFNAAYEKAECQLLMDLNKNGFNARFSNYNEARLEMLTMFEKIQKLASMDNSEKISMDDLEEACEGKKSSFLNKAFLEEEYEKRFGGKKTVE